MPIIGIEAVPCEQKSLFNSKISPISLFVIGMEQTQPKHKKNLNKDRGRGRAGTPSANVTLTDHPTSN
jgi:hypothetical protein